MSSFTRSVKDIVASIPRGETMTYKSVAVAAGNSKAARAVAQIMASNYDSLIPCHRVIKSNGQVGGYNRGGEKAKLALLKAEGVVLKKCNLTNTPV